MIKINQTLFDNVFDLSMKFQDQAETLGVTMLDQAGLSADEFRKPIDAWIAAFKAGRTSFKAFVDDGYRNAEAALK